VRADEYARGGRGAKNPVQHRAVPPVLDRIHPHQGPVDLAKLAANLLAEIVVIDRRLGLRTECGEGLEHRQQPAFPMLLANGFAEMTPCHQTPDQMRQHPIGTGPFKFVEFRPNEYIKLTRNPDYWNPDRPYLDGIEFTILRDRATAVLAFISDKFDLAVGLSPPMMKDITDQVPRSASTPRATSTDT